MFCINMAFNIFVGNVGFYSPEAKGIKNCIQHVLRLLQGGLIALHYLPIGMVTVLNLTPFPASAYHLAATLQGRVVQPLSVLIGLFWSILLILLTTKLMRYSLKKYEAVGI